MKTYLFFLISFMATAAFSQEVESATTIPSTARSKIVHRFDIAVQDVDHDDYYSDLIGGLSVEYIIAYKIDRLLELGVGLGYQRLNRLDQGMVPYFINISGDVLDSRVTPYYNLKVGKTIIRSRDGLDRWEADRSFDDTWLVHPEIGLKMTKHSRIGIGYRINSYNEHVSWETEDQLRETKLQRWTLSYSVSF